MRRRRREKKNFLPSSTPLCCSRPRSYVDDDAVVTFFLRSRVVFQPEVYSVQRCDCNTSVSSPRGHDSILLNQKFINAPPVNGWSFITP